MAAEVLSAYEWFVQAQNGKVRKVEITCAHCGKAATRFSHTTARNNKSVSKFCSRDCKDSSIHQLPAGVICRSPRKSAQTTLEAATMAASKMNIKLHAEGDIEGVQPYECSCGNWHVGHRSKRLWLDAARLALASLTDRTAALAK
jgi:hypothetical protein